MERDKFLTLCRKAKTTKEKITVLYRENQYTPIAYKISFTDSGEVIHTAILHSTKANSIMECALQDVC